MEKEKFIDEIQSAAAGYCYDCDDNDFEVVVKITADDGWVKVEIMQEEK